jgi:hypothetical protein
VSALQRRFFDAYGRMELRLPAPGTYECSLFVAFIGEDHIGHGGPVEMQPKPHFTVSEGELVQVFDLDVPEAAVAMAVERAGR